MQWDTVMNEAEASSVYRKQIDKMRELYTDVQMSSGIWEGQCPEDIMETEVPEEHWIVVRRVLIDGIRGKMYDTSCHWCGATFSHRSSLLTHRRKVHGDELEAWRNEGIPKDYQDGIHTRHILFRYGVTRPMMRDILKANNIKPRKEK